VEFRGQFQRVFIPQLEFPHQQGGGLKPNRLVGDLVFLAEFRQDSAKHGDLLGIGEMFEKHLPSPPGRKHDDLFQALACR
jgi:hypothetical protein